MIILPSKGAFDSPFHSTIFVPVEIVIVKRHHSPDMKLSGLQREVLSLYRKCLRETRKKPMVRRSLNPLIGGSS